MTELESLEEYAAAHGIKVYKHLPLDKDSCAVRVKGRCSIAVTSRQLTEAEEFVCIAHELGHCETSSFYNQSNINDLWGRHEYRANKWAIKHCIPKNDLTAAIQAGYTELWELAEMFDITESFMQKALFYYQNGYIV